MKRRLAFGLGALGLLVSPLASSAVPMCAVPLADLSAACEPLGEDEEDWTGWPSFDGCSVQLPVGAPGWDGGGSQDVGAVQLVDAVQLVEGSEPAVEPRLVTASSLGFASEPGAGFGSSVLAEEIDGSPPLDLVVGAPGTRVNGVSGAGAVYVVFGSLAGLGNGRAAVRLTAASFGLTSDGGGFGSALAFWPDPDSERGRLAIGEPNATVDGASQAGRIVVAKLPGLARDRVISQGHGAGGKAELGDRFASSLSSISEGYLAAGSPYEDVRSIRDAGAVSIIGPDGGRMWTQDSKSVPGKVERGDHFGAVMSSTITPFGDETSGGVWVAAPDEDLGHVRDAGAVVLLYVWRDMESHEGWRPFRHMITASSPGFPGVPETGDRLGAALGPSMIGVPNEDIDGVKDVGAVCAVDVFATSVRGRVRAACFDQDSRGVPGVGERADHFGQALTFLNPGGEDPPILTVVGAPGEDVGTAKDRGAVLVADIEFGDDGIPVENVRALDLGRGQAGSRSGSALQQVWW